MNAAVSAVVPPLWGDAALLTLKANYGTAAGIGVVLFLACWFYRGRLRLGTNFAERFPASELRKWFRVPWRTMVAVCDADGKAQRLYGPGKYRGRKLFADELWEQCGAWHYLKEFAFRAQAEFDGRQGKITALVAAKGGEIGDLRQFDADNDDRISIRELRRELEVDLRNEASSISLGDRDKAEELLKERLPERWRCLNIGVSITPGRQGLGWIARRKAESRARASLTSAQTASRLRWSAPLTQQSWYGYLMVVLAIVTIGAALWKEHPRNVAPSLPLDADLQFCSDPARPAGERYHRGIALWEGERYREAFEYCFIPLGTALDGRAAAWAGEYYHNPESAPHHKPDYKWAAYHYRQAYWAYRDSQERLGDERERQKNYRPELVFNRMCVESQLGHLDAAADLLREFTFIAEHSRFPELVEFIDKIVGDRRPGDELDPLRRCQPAFQQQVKVLLSIRARVEEEK